MRTVATLLALFFVIGSNARSQSSWQRKDAGLASGSVIHSITASGFVAVGSVTDPVNSFNRNVRSTDAGSTWAAGPHLAPLKLKSIGTSFLYGVRPDSNFIMTNTNQGASAWSVLRPVLNMTLTDVHYINTSQAWTVGDTNYAVRTLDNWTNFQIFPFAVDSVSISSMQFLNSDYGIAVGRRTADSEATVILRTTDGGQTWQNRGLPDTCPSASLAIVADFVSPHIGWAVQTCGVNATIYKTTDSAASWFADTTLSSFRAFAIDATDSLHAWVAGQLNVTGAIAKTATGGTSWNFETLPQLPHPPGRLLSLAMRDTATGFACGEAATLLVYAPINTDVSGGRQNRPKSFELSQNYPNPFNGQTRILFTLQKNEPVTLTVYNILGQAVRKLVDETRPAGKNEINWDGQDERGFSVPSGIYLYKLSTATEKQIRKMVLLK
jgi:photosystem II stability/assembly factor-like uncharacterized protein